MKDTLITVIEFLLLILLVVNLPFTSKNLPAYAITFGRLAYEFKHDTKSMTLLVINWVLLSTALI